jgi:ubiquinone/menaquinone biosynthesis C-methylase UbiE
MSDSSHFKAQLREGWNGAAVGWRLWAETLEVAAQGLSNRLVELAQVKEGDHVLDIGTGIGEPAITAARKVGPNGRVLGVDLSREMLAVARERAKAVQLQNIGFREGDIENITLPSSHFNAVIARWSLMFLVNVHDFLVKVQKTMIPGARFATAVWSEPAKVPVITVTTNAVASVLNQSLHTSGMPGPFALSDSLALEQVFNKAGYRDVKSERFGVTFQFKSARDYASYSQSVSALARQMLSTKPAYVQEQAWNAVEKAAKQYESSTGSIIMKNQAICVVGTR